MFRPIIHRSKASLSINGSSSRKLISKNIGVTNATATSIIDCNFYTRSNNATIRSYSSTSGPNDFNKNRANVDFPSLMSRLHHNRNNTYGIFATPQSHFRRWLSSDDASKKKDEEEKISDEEKSETEEGTEEKAEEEEPEKSETDVLKEEVAALKNQLLRSLAEQENIRSIARRDVQSAKDFSTKSFAKSLLEVADNLNRALDSVNSNDAEALGDHEAVLKSFVEGIEMTNSGLIKAFKSNGVEAYCEQPGDDFDATKHQALMEYVDPSNPPGTVGTVMKKGYTLNGRVLRAAEVGVIKKE